MRQWIDQLWKPVCKDEMLLVLDKHCAQLSNNASDEQCVSIKMYCNMTVLIFLFSAVFAI